MEKKQFQALMLRHKRLAWSGALQHPADVERFVVMREQVEALAERLHHAELDPVVDELDEIAGAGRAGMYVSLIGRERAQQRLKAR